MLFEFIGLFLSFLLLMKYSYASKYWYRELLTVTQGGIITYGNSYFQDAGEDVNFLANKEFIVSHWINLKVRFVGYKAINHIA